MRTCIATCRRGCSIAHRLPNTCTSSSSFVRAVDAEGDSNRSLKPLCAGCCRNQSTYVDEADRFYQDPLDFARERYRTGPVPSHVVLYSNLEERLRPVLDEYGFAKVRVRVRVTRCFPGDCRCVRSERYVWGCA